VVPSVVYLRSTIPAAHPSARVLGEERLGAGVAVAPDRVLTAHYLLLGAATIEVQAADRRARVVDSFVIDHESGFGLLRLGGPPLPVVKTRVDGPVAPGLPVFLLTCSGPDERRGATGHVSVVGPFEAFWEYMLDHAIMTTAVNPGLAGAPLFDLEARLIGIVSLALAAVGRYSLAIPLDLYLSRREHIESGSASVQSARAWLGFYPHVFDGGVVITGVVPGGPADQAGLAQGDLILSVDGKSVSNLRELYREMWRKKPGDSLSFQALRESAIRVVEVTAGDRYEFYR